MDPCENFESLRRRKPNYRSCTCLQFNCIHLRNHQNHLFHELQYTVTLSQMHTVNVNREFHVLHNFVKTNTNTYCTDHVLNFSMLISEGHICAAVSLAIPNNKMHSRTFKLSISFFNTLLFEKQFSKWTHYFL